MNPSFFPVPGCFTFSFHIYVFQSLNLKRFDFNKAFDTVTTIDFIHVSLSGIYQFMICLSVYNLIHPPYISIYISIYLLSISPNIYLSIYFIYLSIKEYYKSYLTARQLYSNDKYMEMIPHMEKALQLYFQVRNILSFHMKHKNYKMVLM